MSMLDMQNGMGLGQAVANRNADRAIAKWKDYSNGLNRQLQDAKREVENISEQRLFDEAKLEGLRAYITALQSEVKRLNPNSSLLNPDTKNNIHVEKMKDFLSQKGYDYNGKTVTKMTR